MPGGNIEALVRRNAEACEQAREPKCRCRCGGKYHGKAHSETFVREAVAEIEQEQSQQRGEFDLFDY